MIPARIVAFALLASLTSCFTTVGKWTYPSGRYPTTQSERPAPGTIVVERFLDLRSDTNVTWIVWAYVPLSPGGTMHFDRPEAIKPTTYSAPFDSTPFESDPCEDLARSVAIELYRERIVDQASYSDNGRIPGDTTFVLRGKLRSFYAHQTYWTYGISVFGTVLWALAAPMGTSENAFFVDLELVDAKDGRVVWQGSVFDADHWTEGLYYGPEWHRFPWIWERRLREKLSELATAIGAKPAPLPAELADELRQLPARMPECLGVDSSTPCSAH